MLKNLRNLASRKASKAQNEREETIKETKNKKKKTKEPTPEQEPNILEEDFSQREKEATSEEESSAESTVMPPQANPKRRRQDEVTLQPTSFKSKGNSLQFNFNAGLQDDIEDILYDQNLHESTVEALNAIVSKISKRNKLIKIADRSPAGWANIAE